jgi:uncharacterized protein YceK
MFKYLNSLVFLLLLSGCSSHISKTDSVFSLEKKYAVGSFWNYTETSMAGLRAASIVEGVLSEKKVVLFSMIKGDEAFTLDKNKKSIQQAQIEEAKTLGADYLITGEVQEWRYKTGIDGEPVVSYSVKIIDLKNQKSVFSSVGAKSAWGDKSIGTVAQEIANELLPKFITR